MNDRLIIIARYKENLDWVYNIKSPFMVYNKSDEWNYDFARKDIPNKGREAETYLRSIIENYSILNNYKYISFIQGNPFEHCPDVLDLIDNFDDQKNVGYLTNTIGLIEIGQVINLRNYTISMIDCLLKGNYSDQSGAIKSLLLLNFLGINIDSCMFNYSCGAQYIVPVDFILNKTIDWWMHVYRIFDCYTKIGAEDSAHIFEFIWSLVWNFKEIKQED